MKGRLVPSNSEAEQCVLGTVLLTPCISSVLEVLSPDDFYREDHKAIFEAMAKLHARSEPVDLLTVSSLLKDKGKLDAVGGPGYLASLTDIVPVAANVGQYAELVRQAAVLRKILIATTETEQEVYNHPGGAEDVLTDAQHRFSTIYKGSERGRPQPLGEILPAVFSAVEERCKTREADGSRTMGLLTGYDDLDRMTAGLQRGDLVIVAGRPSMGKTAFSLNLLLKIAKAGGKGLFFTLEQTRDQLCERLLAIESGVNGQSIRCGSVLDNRWPAMHAARARLLDLPIVIDGSSGLSIQDIHCRAQNLGERQRGLDLVVIDQLRQIKQPERGRMRTDELLGDISAASKMMARKLDCPVILVHQINRGVEGREDKRPLTSDLKNCGSLEEDADLILLIYRDEVYNTSPDNPNRGAAEINIGKQRNGPTGPIKLRFNSGTMTFS